MSFPLQKPKIPFTTKPSTIINYAQAITELHEYKTSLKHFSSKYFDEIKPIQNIKEKIKELGNIFVEPEVQPSLEEILDGVQQEKLKIHFNKIEEKLKKNFLKKLDKKIEDIKEAEENKLNIAQSIGTADLKLLEENFEEDANEEVFSKQILADLYILLKSRMDKRGFLEMEYINYIKRFFKLNSDRINLHSKFSADDLNSSTLDLLAEKITDFVKMKFTKQDFNLEVYEGRYIYAEMYVLIRCGMTDHAKKLLYSIPFFNPQFVDKLGLYFENPSRVIHCPTVTLNEDKFKQIIYKIISVPGSIKHNSIISTLEDLLWTRILNSEKNITFDFDDILRESKSSTNKLFVYILSGKYSEARNLLLKGDFSPVDAYYLCNELIKYDMTQIKLFVHFIFIIAKKFQNIEKKAKFISKVNFIGTEEIAKYIVKYEFYDIIKFLSEDTCQNIIQILKSLNKKKELLKLYKITQNEFELVELLEEAVTDEIIKSTNLIRIEDFEYFDVYKQIYEKTNEERIVKLITLMNLLRFKIERNSESLQKTKIFDEEFSDVFKELRCINEIVIIASEVIQKEKNGILAHKLINMMGNLVLNGRTQQLLLKNLISTM